MRKLPATLIAVFVVAQTVPVALAQANGQPITLPAYAVWCTDVSVPRSTDNEQYMAALAEGVSTIDNALGEEASTGTPFIAGSSNQTTDKPDQTGATVHKETVVMHVCASVPPSAPDPPPSQIHRDVHANEVVFAGSCVLANADTCIDNLRAALSKRLDASLSANVGSLFWRSVGAKSEVPTVNDMVQLLTASDARLVRVTPKIAGEAPPVTATKVGSPQLPAQALPQLTGMATTLTTPIDQSVARPLFTARPNWFDFIRQPDDKAIVTAITLSPEMAAALKP